jgi:uroporphyrin-3 C-methyltransferase
MSDEAPAPSPTPPLPRAAGIALILALLAAAAGGYALWLAHDARTRALALESAQSKTEGARAEDASRAGSELEALKRTLENQTRRDADADALGKSLREEVLGLSERAGLMEDALRNLAERRDDGETALRLGEAEFLLRLGAERYRLFHDSATAVLAFDLADGVLATLDDPLYAGVRQTIAAELEQLRARPTPDRTGMIARLDALDATLTELPFGAPGERAQETEQDQTWWGRIKAAFADAVRIRRVASSEAALLGPANAALARQALALDLALAKAGIAAGEDARARTAIGSATRRVAQWLPPEDKRVTAFKHALAEVGTALPEQAPLELGKAQSELGNLRAARTLSLGAHPKSKDKKEP